MDAKAVVALAVAGVCGWMLLRLLIGAPRRARLDRALQVGARSARRRLLALWHWRSARQAAARATQEAIERARRTQVTQQGNVYRPEAFQGKEPRKPH